MGSDPQGFDLMTDNKFEIWRSFGIDIYYYPQLDGGGRVLTPPFHRFILNNPRYNKVYSHLFEWCAGPAFIGFSLLGAGVCSKLYLADINPLAMECVEKTVEMNKLQDRVSFTCSDNFKSIPKEIRFDAIVSNPPNYYDINLEHHYGKLYYNDLRPNDRNWLIHKAFYANVANYLEEDAILLISEVEPYKTQVCIPTSNKTPYDRRPRQPIDDFKQMIEDGGLSLEMIKLFFQSEGIPDFYMLVSRYPNEKKLGVKKD